MAIGRPRYIWHEAHAVVERLSGSREKGNRRGLGGHDREGDRPPALAAPGEQIAFEVFAAASFPNTIYDDADHRRHEHDPVEGPHFTQTLS